MRRVNERERAMRMCVIKHVCTWKVLLMRVRVCSVESVRRRGGLRLHARVMRLYVSVCMRRGVD